MMKSLRQIVIHCFTPLLLLAGCASGPKGTPVKPGWFNMRKSIRLETSSGVTQPHLFYDPTPDLESTSGQVNFLPLALAHSDRAYGFDHLSGQRFFSHFWCRQEDAWKKRGSTPRTPSFTRGIVPRQFDQLHGPQRIIVFGDASRYDMKKAEVYPVRIVGGVVEQVCKSGRCSGRDEWFGRLVLVAVNPFDRSFRDVLTIRDLQDEINWREVQNQLENHEGHNTAFGQIVPAIKVGNLLESKEVQDYRKEHSVRLTATELTDLNRQCGLLYQRLWKDVGKFTTADANLSADDIRKRVQLREDLRKQGKAATFHQLLSGFFAKEGDALATCARLVFPGNPTGNYQRFWFISWVTQYVRMHKDGWRYNCSSDAWLAENEGKSAMEYLREGTGRCSDRGFDLAMNTLPNFLKQNRSNSGDRWAFLEWDNSRYGTHSKIYSWITVPERSMSCPDTLTEAARARWGEKPEGETWPQRAGRRRGLRESDYIF